MALLAKRLPEACRGSPSASLGESATHPYLAQIHSWIGATLKDSVVFHTFCCARLHLFTEARLLKVTRLNCTCLILPIWLTYYPQCNLELTLPWSLCSPGLPTSHTRTVSSCIRHSCKLVCVVSTKSMHCCAHVILQRDPMDYMATVRPQAG